jgi:uncharacterized protein
MRISLDLDPEILTIRRYAPGEIEVAGQQLRAPCIISPARLIIDWAVRPGSELELADLEPILALRPSIVLIGANMSAAPRGGTVRRALEARGIAFESMDLGAACRTYNVLAQERREVVAGLFPREL